MPRDLHNMSQRYLLVVSTEIPTEQNAPKPEKPCFQNTNFEWAEIFKTARLGSHLDVLL